MPTVSAARFKFRSGLRARIRVGPPPAVAPTAATARNLCRACRAAPDPNRGQSGARCATAFRTAGNPQRLGAHKPNRFLGRMQAYQRQMGGGARDGRAPGLVTFRPCRVGSARACGAWWIRTGARSRKLDRAAVFPRRTVGKRVRRCDEQPSADHGGADFQSRNGKLHSSA